MKTWNSRSVASSLHHRIFYAAIRLGGRSAAYLMLVFVAAWYTLRPNIRRRSAPYLKRRFPKAGAATRQLHRFRMTYAFGQTLVDRAAFAILGSEDHCAPEEDKAELAQLAGLGKGLILVTAHVGCWQTSLAALDFLDRPVTVVLHRAEGDVDRHYFEHGDKAPRPGIIDPAGELGGSLDMLAVLRRAEILCITGDRVLGSEKNTVEAPFLGSNIRLPISFYRLASLTGAPVAFVFSRRAGPGRAEVRLARSLQLPPNLGPNPQAYAPHAHEFARVLEEYVQDNPYQYFNFFDIWNTRELT